MARRCAVKTLASHLDDYLRIRRQLGFQLRVPAILLRNFVAFAEQQRAKRITTRLVLHWATQPPRITTAQKANRLGVVRRFARYLSSVDPRTEVPQQRLLPYQFRRRDPHIYQPEDVQKLIDVIGQIDPSQPIKGASYATLIGLLAATGMRVGEAIGLDCGDVDLSRGLVTIRRAKGNKSRLVPLHPTTCTALAAYVTQRDETFPKRSTSSFFVSERGTRLRHISAHRWFVLVACQLGWRRPGDRGGPRIHDLRHYFAIQTMLRWYRTGVNVEAHLAELSTYLGHCHVRDTYWYLSAVPELLQLATERCRGKETLP